MKHIIALIAGLVFGLGLTLSGMTDPQAVLGFLDIFGAWDSRLIFVMAGAVMITLIGFHFILSKPKPYFSQHFSLPKKSVIDKELVIGAALFGLGWGLSGYCPGPAIAGITVNPDESIIFLASMFTGIWLFKLKNNKGN